MLGLREGTWLRVDGGSATIGGRAVNPSAPGPAVLFERGVVANELSGDVSMLLSRTPRFDVRA